MRLAKKEVVAMYAAALEHATIYVDSLSNRNAASNLPNIAFHGLRSEVHAALQLLSPAPGPHADDGADPDLHHARQKAHGKSLWKETCEIIEAAGVSEEGKR